MKNWMQVTLIAVAIIALGSCGFIGTSCAAHLYSDHLLVDQARAVNEAQQRQQAPQAQPQQVVPTPPK